MIIWRDLAICILGLTASVSTEASSGGSTAGLHLLLQIRRMYLFLLGGLAPDLSEAVCIPDGTMGLTMHGLSVAPHEQTDRLRFSLV